MNAKVLIIGGSGFIGRHCLEAFKNSQLDIYATYLNKKPINNGASQIRWSKLDIFDNTQLCNFFKIVKPEYVINTAWVTQPDEYWNSFRNIQYIYASLQIWKYFNQHKGKKIFFLGSCAENFTSTQGPNINTVYGRSKAITQQLISDLYEENSSIEHNYIWGRVFGIFGPYEPKVRLIPSIIESYLLGKPPLIKKPNQVYDYMYVKNLAYLIKSSLFSTHHGAFDLSQGNIISVGDFANFIHKEFFPKAPSPEFEQTNSDKQYFLPNQTHLSAALEKPFISLQDSIKEYIIHLKDISNELS